VTKNTITRLFGVALTLLITLTCVGQRSRQPMNLPKYDKQKIHFGFVLGINNSNFRYQAASNLNYQDSVYSVTPNPQGGLNLGILSNLHLGDNFDLRFMPSLSFVQRQLNYNFYYPATGQAPTLVKTVESTYLELPFDLKFKSKRIDNYRLYVVAGFRTSIDMVSQAKVKEKDPDIVKLNRKDYGYQVGLGADFYMPYFKFSPEIKMFNGIPNLLVQENTVYSNAIESLRSKIFFVSFFFE
jgi:hypothetical protein